MKFHAIRRSIEFTIEQSETYAVRRTVHVTAAWCEACGRDVEMSTPDAATGLLGISTRRIYAGIENGTAHFRELDDGGVLVCLPSVERMGKLAKGELEGQ